MHFKLNSILVPVTTIHSNLPDVKPLQLVKIYGMSKTGYQIISENGKTTSMDFQMAHMLYQTLDLLEFELINAITKKNCQTIKESLIYLRLKKQHIENMREE
ncbi:MAG: hypothetical protein ACH0QD_13150 [Tepidibacillus sp.]